MNAKIILSCCIFSSATLLVTEIQAHEPAGTNSFSSSISIKEKPGYEYKPGGESIDNVYGEVFKQIGSREPKEPDGYTHYISMSGRASPAGPSAIKVEIRDSIHWRARVKFSGHDNVNDMDFSCTVKDTSNIHITALHAATNFKDGAYLTVMRRKPDNTSHDGYEDGECFFVRLSYDDQQKPLRYISVSANIGGTITSPTDSFSPPVDSPINP